MKVVACLLVGTDRSRHAIAAAARLAFPEAVVISRSTLKEALNYEAASDVELLVLANPASGDVANAIEAADAAGLPRWAIVVLGTTPALEGVEIVPPEDWNEPLLARVFGSAVVQWQLRRDNARLGGDLRTIAQRINHDLRSPLGGILSTGEALKEVLAEHHPGSVVLVKSLFDSVADLEKLMDRVSQLTKATANPVSKKPVAMEEVVWAVMQRLERQILKMGAVVTRPTSWPEVHGVPSWLETVWWNLMINALQHGKEAARIELGWSENEREFRFWVCDNGGGVPAEKISTLFQPFHLLHHPNARKGLGLSIVQRLMELQGGNCGYETVATGGSLFFFTLPAGNRRASPLASESLPKSKG